MGSLTAPLALGDSSNGVLLVGVVIVLVLLCAGMGANAWLRVRRIDRRATTGAPEPATAGTPEPAASAPADDLPEDPEYQGPGDWDGGPADPPEFRTPPST